MVSSVLPNSMNTDVFRKAVFPLNFSWPFNIFPHPNSTSIQSIPVTSNLSVLERKQIWNFWGNLGWTIWAINVSKREIIRAWTLLLKAMETWSKSDPLHYFWISMLLYAELNESFYLWCLSLYRNTATERTVFRRESSIIIIYVYPIKIWSSFFLHFFLNQEVNYCTKQPQHLTPFKNWPKSESSEIEIALRFFCNSSDLKELKPKILCMQYRKCKKNVT